MWSKSASCGGWLLKALCSALQCCSRSSTSLYQSSNSNCSSIYYKAARNLQDKLRGWWWGEEGKHQESLSSMVNFYSTSSCSWALSPSLLWTLHYDDNLLHIWMDTRIYSLSCLFTNTQWRGEEEEYELHPQQRKEFRTHSFFGCSDISQEMGGRLTLK